MPQFFKNFIILSFTMALSARMHSYSYMYCAPHRDRVLQRFSWICRIKSYWGLSYFPCWRDLVGFAECGLFQLSMLSAFGANGLSFRFGLTSGAWVSHWACLLFRPSKWACAPIFQTLSVAPQPLRTVSVGKGCNVSCIGSDFHVSARDWIS